MEVKVLGVDAEVPVDVVFKDESGCKVLLDYTAEVLELRMFRMYVIVTDSLMTFMCARQARMLPALGPLSEPPGGSVLASTSVTPSTYSIFRPVYAAANDMESRRSVRDGRPITNIFWNWGLSVLSGGNDNRKTILQELHWICLQVNHVSVRKIHPGH